MKEVRLGFIGLGYIVTNSHLPSLAGLVESGEVVLKLFCDLSEETLQARAAEYSVEATYTSYEEMLDREELDAVYVCLPPTLHTDQVPMVASKGLHVFVEKPPSLVMAQAVEHGAAVQAAGVVSQIGFQSRYYPSAEHARNLLAQRTNRHASVQRFYGGATKRYWTSRFELCGGSLVENTIHTVDLLRYFSVILKECPLSTSTANSLRRQLPLQLGCRRQRHHVPRPEQRQRCFSRECRRRQR